MLTEAKIIWQGESTQGTIGGPVKWSSRYRAISNDGPNDTTLTIKSDPLVAQLATRVWLVDRYYYATDVNITREDDTREVFFIDIDWSDRVDGNLLDDQKGEGKSDNPLEWAAEIEWDGDSIIEQTDVDINGLGIANTVGDSFDPPVETDVPYVTATIEKNLTAVPDWIFDFPGSVNESDFTMDGRLVQAECAKVMKVKVSRRLKAMDIAYRRVTIVMAIRKAAEERGNILDGVTQGSVTPSPWDAIRKNEGLRNKIDNDGVIQIVTATDDYGEQVNAPVPLDAEGFRLETPTPGTTISLAWKRNPRRSFTDLPLS